MPPPRHVLPVANQHMSSIIMSINHFPYLPIMTNPENNPCIQMVTQIATEI